MTAGATAHALVVAKAPIDGRVKTRLGARIGMQEAAALAAAALLDTIDACANAFPGRCHLALDGDLGEAVLGAEIRTALSGWSVFGQAGSTFGERLGRAHHEVAAPSGAVVVQLGMDTPQADADLLIEVADRAPDRTSAVLGPAADGGWWCLALRDPRPTAALAAVRMSAPTTAADTAAALTRRGLRVVPAPPLVDVDTVDDAEQVALAAAGSRFARAWRDLGHRSAG